MWIEALSTAHIEQKNDLEIFALPPSERVKTEGDLYRRCCLCNTRKDVYRSQWLCRSCNVPLCLQANGPICFEKFHTGPIDSKAVSLNVSLTLSQYDGYDPWLVTEWVRIPSKTWLYLLRERSRSLACNGFPSRKESSAPILVICWDHYL
ncbi:hypothetical protein TNCV_3589321 [Trichonephila clavipes]|nr:hypothetical protein TNCV_3589321 [Trichonephila clavipes]